MATTNDDANIDDKTSICGVTNNNQPTRHNSSIDDNNNNKRENSNQHCQEQLINRINQQKTHRNSNNKKNVLENEITHHILI